MSSGGNKKRRKEEGGQERGYRSKTLRCSAENQPEQTSEIILRDWIKVYSKKAVVVFKERGGYDEFRIQ